MRTAEFDDPAFLARLRSGESDAYRQLIRRFHASLVSVASSIIGSRAQAEEVVQDSWLAVFNGIGRFEGRSSLATWLFSIVLNRARTRASREARLVGLPGILDGTQGNERAVDVSEFRPDGHWIELPRLWDDLDPERVVAGRQLWAHVQAAIERLPAGQRAVIVLRDMEGREAAEACDLLGISAENQRVLLHRARGRIRKTIDALISGGAPESAPARPSTVGSPPARPAAPRGPDAAFEQLMVWARAWKRYLGTACGHCRALAHAVGCGFTAPCGTNCHSSNGGFRGGSRTQGRIARSFGVFAVNGADESPWGGEGLGRLLGEIGPGQGSCDL